MCLGGVTTLVEVWLDGDARVGRLADGSVVSLAFVPAAEQGSHLLVHLGVPVEVLDPDVAAEALALRRPVSAPDHGGPP